MADMNFLNTTASTPTPKKDEEAKRPASDVSFHVPDASKADAPKAAASGADVLGGLRSLLSKVDQPRSAPIDKVFAARPSVPLTEPSLPKSDAPSPIKIPPLRPLAISKTPPPRPEAKPPASAPPPQSKGDVLRVSLISVSGSVGMSELAVRARLRTIAFAALIAVVLDALIFGGLTYWRVQVDKQVASAEATVRNLDQEIASATKATAPARDLQALLKDADEVLKNHRHWTQVLAMIESVAKPNVTFSAMSLSDDGTLATSMSAPDFLTIAQQIIAFQADPRVKSVPFTGASKSAAGLATVPLTLTFDPGVLLLMPSATSTLRQ